MKNRYLLGIDYLIDVLKGKYKTSIICQLGKKQQQFEELLHNINIENYNKITRKVLSQQLRSLISCGIVNRKLIDSRPPQTIYSLTTDGQRARKLLIQLSIVGEQLVKKTRNQY